MRNQFVFCTQTYFSETKGAFHFSRRTLEFFSTLSTYGQVFFCFLWVVSGHFKSGLKLHKLSISVQIHPLINEVIFQLAEVQKLSTQYESVYQFRRSYRISLILHRFLRYIQARRLKSFKRMIYCLVLLMFRFSKQVANISSKQVVDFFHILWPSHNVLTLQPIKSKTEGISLHLLHVIELDKFTQISSLHQ